MTLKTGDVIDGKYEIKGLLGEGGMGAVYKGENTLIHRTVAIKVLHAGVAGSQEAVKRFEREAQAAGRIGSDHIVEVLDLGTLESGDRYMVMEFLQGESLSDRIKSRGKLSAAEIGPIAIQMLDGLNAAHEAGIIHRDLKPDNVFLMSQSKGRADYVKLLDFGISKFNGLGTELSMTRTGSVMGTPYYMAPEQAKGAKNLDARLDVYAAGVILYEAVTGQVPFDGDTFNELLFKIVMGETPPVLASVPTLDPVLAGIIDKARQKNPDDRFQSAAEFRSALLEWTQTSAGAALCATALPESSADVAMARTLGAQTGQAWANTAHGAPAVQSVPKRKLGRAQLAVAGGGALLLLVGAGWLLTGSSSEGDANAAAAADGVQVGPTEAELAKARADALAREIEKTKSEMAALKQKAEEDAQREAEERAERERRRQEQEAAEAKAEAERLAEAERKAAEQAQAAALARKRQAAARARAAARAKKKTSVSSSTSGGRKIRTSL